MVLFFEWHQTSMDQTSRSGVPMTGEDTGLGALASPLAGYLGKIQERAASLESCPWCTSKGLTYALRSYRINLQESITLCTNPQCLFPLVSRPLEDVLASLEVAKPSHGSKRKKALSLETEESVKSPCKRRRSCDLDEQNITEALISPAEQNDVNVVSNGHCAAPNADNEKVNEFPWDPPAAETTGRDSPQDKQDVLSSEPENSAGTGGVASPQVLAGDLQSSSDALLTTDASESMLAHQNVTLDRSLLEDVQVKNPHEALNKVLSLEPSQTRNEQVCSSKISTPTLTTELTAAAADITASKDIEDSKNRTRPMAAYLQRLVNVPNQFFWKNSDSLCWLDSVLVALVKSKSLKRHQPPDEPQQASVWRLMKDYEDICDAVQVHHQPGHRGVMKVPNYVLQKANADLRSLRMSVFEQLQPKLHCELGQRETPVFVLPLLLAMDSWAEPLFQSTFQWEFKCSECQIITKERVMKTLPTFTNISPDWHPLHATHLAPCNACGNKNQQRTMLLERVPPVFGLHFVEGLPDNNIKVYAFTFEGKSYSVTTVIQYNQQLKHFVTWISNSNGSWLEYDDLKHPRCKTHKKLPVPAEEIHVVFWETDEDNATPACSPTSTSAESGTSLVPGDKHQDRTVLTPHNDSDIICALSATNGIDTTMVTTVTGGEDTSIGSTTLLSAFEGLTHDDIVTLTLEELKADSQMQPVNDNSQVLDAAVPSADSTPDSSSTQDDDSNDPSFVPQTRARRGGARGRAKPAPRIKAKKEVSNISPLASAESRTVTSNQQVTAAAQDNTPPAQTTQPAVLVSSTDPSALSCSQERPSMVNTPTSLQIERWSYLLSKHPLNPVREQNHQQTTLSLSPQVKPTPPAHSTPNPVRRQQVPSPCRLKLQLQTEGAGGLPVKAAEMYNAFGAKSSSAPSPLASPSLHKSTSVLPPPSITNPLKTLMNTTVLAGASRPLTQISSSKKRSGHSSSKIPTGVSETEQLRYKLMKKLKAKKKALAKLNMMLGQEGGAGLRPDSTALSSPNTVTSSTYDGSIDDDFLSDLLSPATTASNLSPDSTDFLEMLAGGQDKIDRFDCGTGAIAAAPQVQACTNEPSSENFLDFLSQRPSETETEALSALEFFM